MPPRTNVAKKITPAPSPASSSTPAGITAPKLSITEFNGLLKTMQVDATIRLVNYYHGAQLVYDAGLAGKIVARMSRTLGDKMGSSKGAAVVEGGKAINLIRSTVTEIMAAVEKAMGATASNSGISDKILGAVKERAVDLVTSAFGPSFVASATPIVSLLPDVYKAVTKNYAAVEGIVKAVQAHRYAKVVKIGSPRSAADAVGTILERKAAYLTAQGATSLVNLGTSVATAATGGISAAAEVGTKVATLIVDLIAEITMLAIEMYEFAQGERMLNTINTWPHQLLIDDDFAEDLFPASFDICPLLGCYMLGSAPYFNTSDFVTLAAGPDSLASVDEIQRIAVTKVNPLRLYASQIINESKIKLKHQNRSDINKVMSEAGLRADAVEKASLTGRAKAALNQHILGPLKRKFGFA